MRNWSKTVIWKFFYNLFCSGTPVFCSTTTWGRKPLRYVSYSFTFSSTGDCKVGILTFERPNSTFSALLGSYQFSTDDEAGIWQIERWTDQSSTWLIGECSIPLLVNPSEESTTTTRTVPINNNSPSQRRPGEMRLPPVNNLKTCLYFSIFFILKILGEKDKI